MKKRIVLLGVPAQLLLALVVSAADQITLVPLHICVQGAFGSAFVSDLWVFNPTSTGVWVRGLEGPCVTTTCTSPTFEMWIEHQTTVTKFSLLGKPGVFVISPAETPLVFNLRARDTSRSSKSAGTAIPVVPLDRFGEKITLLGILNQEHFRSMVRIYGRQSSPVTVEFYRESDNTLIERREIELSTPAFEFEPAYAEVRELPGLSAPYRVEILSSASNKVWAFASTTNNETQEITITAP